MSTCVIVGFRFGVHQALSRGDDRAVAVAGDRPSLEHHVDGPCGMTRTVRRTPDAASRIGVERQELLTPRVERPVGRDPFAGVVEHVDRAGVTKPRVVDRQLDDLHARAAQRCGALAEPRRRQHRDRLEPCDRVRPPRAYACSAASNSLRHSSAASASTSPCARVLPLRRQSSHRLTPSALLRLAGRAGGRRGW